MEIVDLRSLDGGRAFDVDLCIVGSGPAGLTIAGEFIGTSIRTLVVESGGLVEQADVDGRGGIESVGQPRIMDQRLVRNRILGGTSHSWTGRCAPFDDVDFAARPWVPHSGWPIPRPHLDPFLDRACNYLGIKPSRYDDPPQGSQTSLSARLDAGLLRSCLWQFSTDAQRPLDYMRFGPAFLAKSAPNVRVLLNATVSHITTNPEGSRVTELEVTSPDRKRAVIRPKAVALCGGGIENARMLLYSKRVIPQGVGNRHDMVGRFLMDHPRCALAEFDPAQAAELRDDYGLFKVGKGADRRTFIQGVALSPKLQAQEGLLNCAAWLTEDRAPDDPWDAAKRLASGDYRRPGRDAWSVLSQPKLVASGVTGRLVRGRGLPHKLKRLVLDCIVEQRPDPESRLVLGTGTDAFDLPIARLDWRISDQERKTVARLGGLIGAEFQRVGLARPALVDWIERQRPDEARFVDVCHPTGTTRMADDPARGVVDPSCQVHGVDGLFVAGSSVFPTTGHANPTLMIVALAIRLADTLKRYLIDQT